jgi:hypothetical protein
MPIRRPINQERLALAILIVLDREGYNFPSMEKLWTKLHTDPNFVQSSLRHAEVYKLYVWLLKVSDERLKTMTSGNWNS